MHCDELQHQLQYSFGQHLEEQLMKEKQNWEQEQNYLIRRELSKLSEEKNKDLTRLQEEILSERDKNIKERERVLAVEKVIIVFN